MHQYENLKEHYKFTKEEALILKGLQPKMRDISDEFIEHFSDYIWGFGTTSQFLKDQETIDYHKEKVKEWFINLFSGKYDLRYFTYLYKIGEIHVKIGLPTHFVNSAFTFVRTFILKNIDNEEQRLSKIEAVEKIVDINLDMLTSSYREEELGKFLSMSKFEKSVLSTLKKFNSYVNFFLAGSLALVAFFAVGLFVYDIYLLFFFRYRHRKRYIDHFRKSACIVGGDRAYS